MKQKLFYFLMGLITLVMTSCNNKFKSVPLTATLATFTEEDALGNPNLIGVKDLLTEEVIIKPDTYANITADENLITCIKVENGYKQIQVYKHDGTELGLFDTFNHLTSPGDYYLGTNYNVSCYYFPKTHAAVRGRAWYTGIRYLFLETDSGWKVFTFNGELGLLLPENAKVVHNLTSEGKEKFYLVMEEKSNVVLLDIDDMKTTKVYTLQEWIKTISQKEEREFSHLTIIKTENI